MEAVGAGAGVLAFITIALRSTKTIYEIASVIRNGPADIEHLASAVHRLQLVLTQFSKLPALADSELDPESFNLLSMLLKTCSKDVTRFEHEFRKVQISPGDMKAGIAWKKIKTILKDAEFHRMREVVNSHVTELGVQLSMIQSNTGSFCKDKLIHLTETISERADNDRAHKELLRQANADLSTINDNVKNLNDTSLSIEGQLRHTLAPLVQKMDQIPEMSAMQSENICVLLRALQDQVSGLSSQMRGPEDIPHRKPLSPDDPGQTNNDIDSEKGHELLQSIERLCQLAKQKGGTVSDKEAEVIADDLNALLDSASVQLSHGKSESHASKKRSIDLVEKERSIDGRELKRMRSLLTSSDSIVINQRARPFLISRDGKITGKCNVEEVQTAHGKIIMTIKRRQWCSGPGPSDEKITNQKNTTEFIGTITAILDQFQANVTINLHQRAIANGYLSLCPSISVGMILPDDSKIFDIVREGDMDGLLSLLSQGEASLRDRNSFGTPLLHFATEQPDVCKFLIENGADIDEIAPLHWAPKSVSLTALACDQDEYYRDHDNSENEKEVRSRRNECRRLLLNAGADPAIFGNSSNSTFILDSGITAAAVYGNLESMQLVLDLGESFIDLEEKDQSGDDPLLNFIRRGDMNRQTEKVALLLRRGSKIHTCNSRTGDTCLHLCIRSSFHHDDESFDKESLVFLVKYGADIDACNYEGISVSECAYEVTDYDDAYGAGSYQGDLWDAVLSECGFDITERRKGFPRRPLYSKRGYTRENFERLWRGREKFCPYYDDPPVWDPEGIDNQELSEVEVSSEEQEYSEVEVSSEVEESSEEQESFRDREIAEQWEPLDGRGSRAGNGEDGRRRDSESEEPESPHRSVTGHEEESPTETVPINVLPPLRDNGEATMAQRPSLPSLASIFTIHGVSTMEPASPWQHSASSSQVATSHWGDLGNVHLRSSISDFRPSTWQDWPATRQITDPENDLPAEFRSGVFELETNPWLETPASPTSFLPTS